ncbi:MAG: ADOP family duplicated permease, partial [Gemmatimonadetes bacterium]|nr:ADOP family duplicated permease [Gemmatimonadota bacterium]
LDTSAGTPAYVSPEQASGEAHIDGRADVYSLACVAFEMLAGEAPFTGSTTQEIISKRFYTLPPDVRQRAPHVSEPLSHVLRQAMAVDPAKRFVSVTAFANALADAGKTGRVFAASVRHHMTRVRHALPNIERAIPQKLRGPWMTDLLQDVTFAVRSFRKRWAQTLVLLLTATLGIGLNSAVFSIVHAVMLRSLPYPDAHQLVKIWRGTTTDDRQRGISFADFSDVSTGTSALEAVAAYVGVRQPIVGGETPTHGAAYTTTERFFDVFGVPPLLGATRAADDGSPVAIISYGLWQRSFGGDSLVLQRTISISGRSMPIVGVMPPGFAYPRDGEAWMPQEIGRIWGFDRGAGGLHMVGRMSSDVTMDALRGQLDAVASQIRAAEPAWSTLTYPPVPLHDTLAANGRATLMLLLGVVAMILLVACANVAGVFTADVVGRQREMTVRRALGASTTRLIRQMLTETTLLGITGAVLALVAAQLSVAFVNGLVPAGYLHSGGVRLELPVVLFTLAVGVGSGVLFGLLPALRVAAQELRGQTIRKEDLQRGGSRYLGGFLVIPQYALSLAVVVVALVMVKSLFSLLQVDPGFVSEGLVTAEIGLTRDRYEESEPQVAFRNALVAELEARPGVTSVAFEYTPPLVPGANIQNGVQLPDEPDRVVALAQWRAVTPQYFRTAGVPVLQGRAFKQSDGPQTNGVVVVNRALAMSLWPDSDPVGRRLRPRLLFLSGLNFRNGGWMTVVGVVGDVHHRTLSSEPFPAVYLPASQHPGRAISMHLVMRVSPVPDNLNATVVDAVARIDPNVPVGSVSLMDDWVRRSVAAPRFRAVLLAAFGAIAVTLVLLGMYGVISQSVRHRSRELAVRAALGADSGRMIRLVTSECVRYVLVGQLIGTALVLVGTRWLDSLVFGISGLDFTTYAVVSVLLTAVVLGTSYLPARRAGRANPVDALREQ